jgi:zinc transport system substrate-binding protein
MRNILIFAMAALLIACTEKESTGHDLASERSKPVVVTSNYPLYFFSSQIAGDIVDLRFPSIEGDPAMWVPDGDEAAMLQSADLLILNGAGYESWLSFTTLSGENILDTTANVQAMLLPIENTTVHQHGPQGKHSHQGTAFTTWLDPELAIEQSRSILQAVMQLKPDQSEVFRTNFEQLEKSAWHTACHLFTPCLPVPARPLWNQWSQPSLGTGYRTGHQGLDRTG